MRIEGRWLAGADGVERLVGQRARIRGPLPVILEPGSLELSVIGRNLLDQFTLIYSAPGGCLCC